MEQSYLNVILMRADIVLDLAFEWFLTPVKYNDNLKIILVQCLIKE